MADKVVSSKVRYLYHDIVERVKGMIRAGELRPGYKIPPERALSERFGVSRNCIRQAIQSLSEKGILESRQGDGTYVCAPDDSILINSFAMAIQAKHDLLREILEFRLLMEPQIAFLAAKNITADELDRLKIIVCDQERRMLAGKEDSEMDEAFHLGLAVASKNRIIQQVMDTTNGILSESRSEPLRSEARRRASIVGHLRIIDALEARDSEAAFAAMRDHLTRVEQLTLGDVKMDGKGAEKDE